MNPWGRGKVLEVSASLVQMIDSHPEVGMTKSTKNLVWLPVFLWMGEQLPLLKKFIRDMLTQMAQRGLTICLSPYQRPCHLVFEIQVLVPHIRLAKTDLFFQVFHHGWTRFVCDCNFALRSFSD